MRLAVGFWHIWEPHDKVGNSDVKPSPPSTIGKIMAYMIKLDMFKAETRL
jgi:hypothetical protein